MDIYDIIGIRRELIKINHTKDKTKKIKDIVKIVIAIIILCGIVWIIFCVSQNVEEANNSSWNNLKNVAKNQYLNTYGLNPDTQYREYLISSNGIRIYNDKDYSPDNTNLLEGSNYNDKILYTASNIVGKTFLMRNKDGKLEFSRSVIENGGVIEKDGHVSKSYLENNSSAYLDIAEYIHKHIKYDTELSNQMNNNDVTLKDNQSAIATFNSGEGVCEGISELYTSMCRSVGLPVKLVTGTVYKDNGKVKVGGHAWNEVLINGKWEIFDVTNNIIAANQENYQAKEILEFK